MHPSFHTSMRHDHASDLFKIRIHVQCFKKNSSKTFFSSMFFLNRWIWWWELDSVANKKVGEANFCCFGQSDGDRGSLAVGLRAGHHGGSLWLPCWPRAGTTSTYTLWASSAGRCRHTSTALWWISWHISLCLESYGIRSKTTASKWRQREIEHWNGSQHSTTGLLNWE